MWDVLGSIHNFFNKAPANQGPFNADGKVNFGTTLDTAKNLPKNPTSFNDHVETAREAGVNAAEFVLKPVAITFSALDAKSNGAFGKALMAGTGNVRSNYAYVRDVAKYDAGMAFLSGLGMIAGGVLGGIAGFAGGLALGGVGAIPGAIGGFAVGVGAAGKAERSIAESGTLGKSLTQSAKLSQSAVGQEKYNFGRDVVHTASNISGWKTLGDTSKGIGALTSGLINFGFEIATAPDLKGARVAGVTIKGATAGGITAKLSGPIEKSLAKVNLPVYGTEVERQAARLAKDIDLHKQTGAGVKTIYTPLYEFNQKSDVIAIQKHSQFNGNEYGQMAASLLAGQDNATQSLIFRIGRGDKAALIELEKTAPSVFASLVRYEGKVKTVISKDGSQKSVIGLSEVKGVKTEKALQEAELADLVAKNAWLERVLNLDSSLSNRTASMMPKSISEYIEKTKIDRANQRMANGLEFGKLDITTRETSRGRVMQTIWQASSNNVVIRSIQRAFDDAPHQTINYNDALQSNNRFRTTARMGIKKEVLTPEEARNFTNDFAMAKNEGEKDLLVDRFTEKIFESISVKYNVPKEIRDRVFKQYQQMSKINIAKAKEAKLTNKAYFVEGEGLEQEIIRDPQLISQLANGGYLPDIELLDKTFKAYKDKSVKAKLMNASSPLISIADDFQSIWRTFTLARLGFPINIMRDSTLRAWGDGVLFDMMKNLTGSTINAITNGHNSISKIRRVTEARLNPKKNLKNIREEIQDRQAIITAAQKTLDEFKYNPAKPPKNISTELQRHIDYIKIAETELKHFRNVRDAIEQNIPSKVISRKKMTIEGVEGFDTFDSGVQGQIMLDKIRGTDTIRGLVSSNRELGMAKVRVDRNGGVPISAIKNEDLHIQTWEKTLTNQLANDPVAKLIMNRKMTEKEIIKWIANDSGAYLERFGYVKDLKRKLNQTDAKYVYNRVLNVVNTLAPDVPLQKLVIEGKVTQNALKELYPNLEKRPDIISDLVIDTLGQSNFVQSVSNGLKNWVTWLATVPTSKLSYNPYFAVKYQEKLQNMVALANSQGRKLSEMDQRRFESVARSHALNEYRNKINAFNRDMNYPEFINYIAAFFPAVVEQFRSYGKIMLDHPEFPYKIQAMSMIPDQYGDVQEDGFGNKYVEVTLPLLNGLKGRLPITWFDALNPTGGHILSAGPLVSFGANKISQTVNLPEYFTRAVLPFGTTANTFAALTPNTLRRASEAFEAYVFNNGEKFNKDINMFMEKERFDFTQENHREPSSFELQNMYETSKKDAQSLSLLRALGSGILPSQPTYYTALQVYSDLLSKYQNEYGADGSNRFIEDYPDYFLLVDKLTDSTSGIRSDDTAVALVKKNPKVIENIIAAIGEKGNLQALGAIFNDDNYAFSSAAQTYLMSNAIPGTKQKFKEQGAALENNRSSIVNKGWRDYTKLIDVVSQELIRTAHDPATGYGASILDGYKKQFTEKMKVENNLWYQEKQGAGFQKKQVDTVDALTIALNTPELWKDLAKQDRWYTIAEYLNYRYVVHDALVSRGVTINTNNAVDIKNGAAQKIAQLRAQDINFGRFYDRYFSDDDFSYVSDLQSTGGK